MGGMGGASENKMGLSRLGLHAEPRADDAERIVALGGAPYPLADSDRAQKNAFLRVELALGDEPGKLTKLRMDHQFYKLGETSWPSTYDAWSVGNSRELVLSLSSEDPKEGPISYCELAETATFDTAIVAAATRLRSFVDDNVKEALYLAWGHEQSPLELRPTLTTLNTITFTGTPNQLVVNSRKGVGITCPIAKGTQLLFTSPDGQTTVKTLTFEAAKVGDQNVYVSAVSGTIGSGWTVTYQTPTEFAASYVAAWKKVHAVMRTTWGMWAGSGKVRWTWVVQRELGTNILPTYPGDEEVDVVGVDAVNPYRVMPNAAWLELEQMLAGARTFAAQHGAKDVVVASTGSLDGAIVKTTAPALGGVNVPVAIESLPLHVAAGTEVFFYDSDGLRVAKGIVASLCVAGSEVLPLDSLSGDVPAAARVLLRVATLNKATWVERAAAFLKCAPDVKGAVWYTGTPGGFWLDQEPEALPDVLDAFRGWAKDPYFGAGG